MAELTYLDFDLWIGDAAESYVAKGRDAHGREATVDFRMPFSEREVTDFWARIGLTRPEAHRHAAGPGGRDHRPDLAPIETTESYGGSLFEALFHGDLLICLRRSLEQARGESAGLRIRLRLADVPELANLPWEYLYDVDSGRFLALSMATPVVRYLERAEPLRRLAVRPPLKMLVMVASPRDYDALEGGKEWRRLNEELGGLQEQGLIELERLEGATLAALQRRLRRGGAHIFHFIGHGDFDAGSQEGVLIFEDESGRGRSVSSDDLAIVLRDHAPRLVVLNACKGARTSRRDPFAGVAQTLIRPAIPPMPKPCSPTNASTSPEPSSSLAPPRCSPPAGKCPRITAPAASWSTSTVPTARAGPMARACAKTRRSPRRAGCPETAVTRHRSGRRGYWWATRVDSRWRSRARAIAA